MAGRGPGIAMQYFQNACLFINGFQSDWAQLLRVSDHIEMYVNRVDL